MVRDQHGRTRTTPGTRTMVVLTRVAGSVPTNFTVTVKTESLNLVMRKPNNTHQNMLESQCH